MLTLNFLPRQSPISHWIRPSTATFLPPSAPMPLSRTVSTTLVIPWSLLTTLLITLVFFLLLCYTADMNDPEIIYMSQYPHLKAKEKTLFTDTPLQTPATVWPLLFPLFLSLEGNNHSIESSSQSTSELWKRTLFVQHQAMQIELSQAGDQWTFALLCCMSPQPHSHV